MEILEKKERIKRWQLEATVATFIVGTTRQESLSTVSSNTSGSKYQAAAPNQGFWTSSNIRWFLRAQKWTRITRAAASGEESDHAAVIRWHSRHLPEMRRGFIGFEWTCMASLCSGWRFGTISLRRLSFRTSEVVWRGTGENIPPALPGTSTIVEKWVTDTAECECVCIALKCRDVKMHMDSHSAKMSFCLGHLYWMLNISNNYNYMGFPPWQLSQYNSLTDNLGHISNRTICIIKWFGL